MYKAEVVKRLNKIDYLRLPRLLDINQSFDNIENEDDYKRMLQIADTSGIKYLSFYKLKDNININDIISSLNQITYSPNLPYIEGQEDLSIAKVTVNNDNSFDIISNFYNLNEVWIKSEDRRSQSLEVVSERRVIHIEYFSEFNILIGSIDPVGMGASVTERLERGLIEVFDNFGLSFNNSFDILELEEVIYDKVDAQELRPTKILNKDETRNIEFHSEAKNPIDSLIDQDCYTRMRDSELDIKRMKLKKDNSKMTIELFSTDTIRIWNKSNWEQINEFKRDFSSIL